MQDGEEKLLLDALVDSKTDGGKERRQRELERNIQSAVNSLPLKYREVMLLCGLQGLSYKEVAVILYCSVQNVGGPATQSKRNVKEILGEKMKVRK